jgi:hypothetical protein
MSTAATAEVTVQERKKIALVPAGAPAAEVTPQPWKDEHPLLPVFVAMVIALFGSAFFVGSVLIWLAIRHSGVLWP